MYYADIPSGDLNFKYYTPIIQIHILIFHHKNSSLSDEYIFKDNLHMTSLRVSCQFLNHTNHGHDG